MKLCSQKAAAVALLVAAQFPLAVAPAWADPEPPVTPDVPATTEPVAATEPAPQQLRNITYRARIDGVARGALITYKINDTQVQTADPTMLPGRVFEAQTVLSDANLAGMQVSIQWPYGANLHCEILVDDATVVAADQFIRPRLTRAEEDPDYGKLLCGAPLINPIGYSPVTPADTGAAPAVAPPAPVVAPAP
jgi:hypothetical protein